MKALSRHADPSGFHLIGQNHPIYAFCLPGGWEMTIVHAHDGSEWLVPGTHPDDASARVSSWAPALVLRPDVRPHVCTDRAA